MKQIPQQKIKDKLKAYYTFKECDFYSEDGIIYTISKDNYMERVRDVWEDLELQRKDKYIMGCDPYKQDEESESYGAVFKVRVDGTFEVVKYEK